MAPSEQPIPALTRVMNGLGANRGRVFRVANSSSTVLVSVAVGCCEPDRAHQHRCPVAGDTAQCRMPKHTLTAQLKTLPPSHAGPPCHVAASVPRSASGPWTRVGTLMTLMLVLSLAPRLSMLASGTRSLSCAPRAMRVHLASAAPAGKQDASPLHGSDNTKPPTPATRRCGLPVPPGAGKQPSIHNADRTGHEPFPKPAPTVLPLSRPAEPTPSWQGTLVDSVSDLGHHQCRLSVLQWNPGPARKNPTHILASACGQIHVVILQEANDHVPRVSDQFMAYTDGNDLAILLNKGIRKPGENQT